MADAHDHLGKLPDRIADPVAPRIGHAEREIVIRRLQLALHEGQLDLTELDRRLATTYAAVTAQDLAAVTADLPEPAAAPVELRTKSGTRSKTGHWTVPAQLTAVCNSGTIKIDFTEALCAHAEVSIDAEVGSGTLLLIVPRGWRADLDQVRTGSGSVVDKVTAPPAPGAPLIRVRGKVGSGTVKARYPRRSFLQWLLRRQPD